MENESEQAWSNFETIQAFDAGLELFENCPLDFRDSVNTLPEVNLSSLLILCLVEQLCSFTEKDPAKAQRLKDVIVMQLQALNLVDEISPSEDFTGLRAEYKESLFRLVTTAQRIVDQETGALVRKPSSQNGGEDVVDLGPVTCRPRSRYLTEFENLNYINKGAFGEVYGVKNKLDGQNYAVKKIPVRSQDMLSKSIQKEVTVLASLRHPNIVKYYGAWLEPVIAAEMPPTTRVSIVEEREVRHEEHYEYSYHRNSDLISLPRLSLKDASSGASFIVFKSDSNQESKSSKSTVKEVGHRSSVDSQIYSGDDVSEDSDSNSNKVLVPAHKLASDHSILYIQMELCGLTLRKWIDSKQNLHILAGSRLGALQLRTSLGFFWQLAAALEYLHNNKIIHHDIKPGNIFVSGTTGIKLGDFGLACQYELSKEISHRSVGTYTYAAPEQLQGGLCNFKSDIFSCGMILLELLMPAFNTMSERVEVLNKLRNEGIIPDIVERKLPDYAKIISLATMMNPKNRPTAAKLKTMAMQLLSDSNFQEVNEEPKSLDTICQEVLPKEKPANRKPSLPIKVDSSTAKTIITSRTFSNQTRSTRTMERQMRSLITDEDKERKFEEVHSTTLVNRVNSSGDLQPDLNEDEETRLRRENSSLKDTIFMLEQEISFLKTQIRMQGVQLNM